MSGALVVSAFAAGLVATVNPCGFAMLPAYLSFFIGSDRGVKAPVPSALRIAVVMTVSFLAVFGVTGLLLAVGVHTIIDAIPWLALVAGIGVAGLGVYVLSGGVISLNLPGTGRVNRRSVFMFGSSYAIASLSCTLPIFLSLVVGSIATAAIWESIVLFLVYGLGIALVIAALTLGLALGRDRVVGWIRTASRWMPLVSGLVLTASGAFVIWYWATVLAVGSLELADVGVVRWFDSLSASISNFVRDNMSWAGAGLLVAIALGWRALSRGPGAEEDEKPGVLGEQS